MRNHYARRDDEVQLGSRFVRALLDYVGPDYDTDKWSAKDDVRFKRVEFALAALNAAVGLLTDRRELPVVVRVQVGTKAIEVTI